MPVWKATSVDDEPATTLVKWQVVQFADGERSLVSYAVESREGRVSSAVRTFDVAMLRGNTKSRRVYQLRGEPRVDPDAAYLWRRYASAEKEATWTDVTPAVWLEHAKAREVAGAPVMSKPVSIADANHG